MSTIDEKNLLPNVYSKIKEFAKFFSFKVDPFSEGKQINFYKVVSPKSVSNTFQLTCCTVS